MVTTKQSKDKDPGPSGLGANHNTDENVSGAASIMEPKCPECDRTFPTQRSLGMHRYHLHPQAVNTERLATMAGRKKFWSEHEDTLLIRLANQIWQPKMPKTALYDLLQSAHPQRTAEALKRRLRTLGWQPEATAHGPRPTT
ncbi:MAG: C2H2-type zinc finger protein [Aeromonas sp.]